MNALYRLVVPLDCNIARKRIYLAFAMHQMLFAAGFHFYWLMSYYRPSSTNALEFMLVSLCATAACLSWDILKADSGLLHSEKGFEASMIKYANVVTLPFSLLYLLLRGMKFLLDSLCLNFGFKE